MDQCVCRLCGLEKDSMSSIFKEDLVENIERFLHIRISLYDMLPHKICATCEDEIKRIVRFIGECQEVQDQHHKKIFIDKNKIPEKDIKLEDEPLDIETSSENCLAREYEREKPQENKFEKTQEYKLEKPRGYKLDDCIVFERNFKDFPTSTTGTINTSILLEASNDQYLTLCSIGNENLKHFGRMVLYERFWDRIVERRHLKLTFDEIRSTFEDFQKTLTKVDDPIVKLEPTDELEEEERNVSDLATVPTILVNPCQETVTPDTNYLEFCSDSSVVSESNDNDPKIVKCTKCPFTADRQFRVNQHNFEVHDKRFLCEPCGRRFGKNSKLLQHTKMYHTDLGPIECSFCSLSFNTRYEQKKHLKTHSSGEGRLWHCAHCNESFNVQHKLDIHVSKCHKSKSVKCSRCSYIAAHKYQIKQHVREVHEKSIICDHCGKRESKKCRMIAHIQKKHMPKTEFVCNRCQARYFSKAWFEKHQREGCP